MGLIKKKWHYKCVLKKYLLRHIFKYRVNLPQSVTFRDNFKIYVEKTGHIKFGERVFFNNDCSITSMNMIVIGNDCIFGENVKIYDHNHIFKNVPEIISKQGYKSGTVTIGQNCWIGSNTILLKGAEIGSHSVISAGLVIDYYVPEFSIVRRDGTIEKIHKNDEEKGITD